MPGMTDVTPPPLPGDAGSTAPPPTQTKSDPKVGRHRAALDQLADRLNVSGDGGTAAWNGKPKDRQHLLKKYMDKYSWLKKQGYDLSGYGTFDVTSGEYSAAGSSGLGTGPVDPTTGQPTGGAAPEDPWSPENPHGPSPQDIIATVQNGFPAGFNINSSEGARTLEALYPYVKDAYNQSMQQKAVTTGLESLDELKNDPIFSTVSAAVVDKVNNPFTFDDQTVALMRSSVADQAAVSEAALGERLRSMGASQGIDPSSPLFASLAQQATLSRDINLANMERDLDIKLATQRQQDKESAIAMGSQFAGGYQSLMGQRYGDLANIQRGAQMNTVANPFAGIWDSVMLQDEISNQGGQGMDYGSMLSSGATGAGTGAAVGSVVPGLGTGVGAGLGFLVGAGGNMLSQQNQQR